MTEAATITPISTTRTADATVPLADLSLGLSYEVGRVKVGAGHRWERFFDSLDVGYEASYDADEPLTVRTST